ncbi:uncharacterized protein LOC124664716 [Lolium rigidum]|uniref:uncharacterized protein LOC124664716 n=1 Tax=Lolium rigidum TaxID=89674 RepID=UPI001F5D61EF|nr:uncharacterized protein LOC124664716 [Lolium rigidum]
MGCISSKILTRSGSLQEKANRGFQRSGLVEDIILSNSKSSGDQFLALLRTSSAAARRSKADASDQSRAPAAAASKIETINVSDLLAGLEEEEYNTAEEEDEERERRDDRKEGAKISPRCLSDGAGGSARSFRTLEEFDAMVTRCSSPEQPEKRTVLASEPDASGSPTPQQSSSPEQPEPSAALALEPDVSVLPPRLPESSSSEQDAVATATSATPGQGEARGAKRRARARQLGELSAPAPAGFDFSKSGSLRDWLLGGGQIFSPGSYATPKFGKVAAVPSESEEHGERRAVFDPELVAQLEEAMEELSVDEERVLREVLEAIEAGETEGTESLERLGDRAAPPVVAVQD